MQDNHSISGAGRFFGGGDRRIRPLNYQNQSLKCPRCDSINTKFCYYNNYNLSQPRYFCKICRRYWTKGGVLRNVPVGGGCRKTKRSKPDKSSEKKLKSNENSSSESSSLTTTTPASAPLPEVVAPARCLTSKTTSFEIPTIFCTNVTNPCFEPNSSEIGRFDPTAVNFNRSDVSQFRLNQQQNHEQSWQAQSHVNDEMTVGFPDQTVHIDLPRFNKPQSNNEAGFAPLDWQLSGGGDQNLFEFTTTVDQSYWNQNQWPSSDHDHTLYLP